jgi:hypothetical protein
MEYDGHTLFKLGPVAGIFEACSEHSVFINCGKRQQWGDYLLLFRGMYKQTHIDGLRSEP